MQLKWNILEKKRTCVLSVPKCAVLTHTVHEYSRNILIYTMLGLVLSYNNELIKKLCQVGKVN